MTADVPPGSIPGTVTPAEREAHWNLFVRFAIEATGADDARAVLSLVLAGLDEQLPLQGVPVVHPRWPRNPDEIWVAELAPDLRQLQVIDPDDAPTRCRFVQGYFPMGVNWIIPQNTDREAKAEWPPDIWQRQHGKDDVLMHPAVRGVMIHCQSKQA